MNSNGIISDSAKEIYIPDFVVRQVGQLQLQLAAANEQIANLTKELMYKKNENNFDRIDK